MSRTYGYVGPAEIADAVRGQPAGWAVRSVEDVRAWLASQVAPARGEVASSVICTYTVDADGVLHVADRHSEHVACAGFAPVRAAGELGLEVSARDVEVTYLSNQSTGFCPDVGCLGAVQAALRAAGLEPPEAWSAAFTFRRCTGCGMRNVVKEDWFVCGMCGEELPADWNF